MASCGQFAPPLFLLTSSPYSPSPLRNVYSGVSFEQAVYTSGVSLACSSLLSLGDSHCGRLSRLMKCSQCWRLSLNGRVKSFPSFHITISVRPPKTYIKRSSGQRIACSSSGSPLRPHSYRARDREKKGEQGVRGV